MNELGLKPVFWIYTFVCLFNFLGTLFFMPQEIRNSLLQGNVGGIVKRSAGLREKPW